MQIQTPDIGVDKALVAEILVKVGDHVAVDDSLLVLESDKATVEVPSTKAGIVKNILVQQGDEVTEGVALIELEDESQTAESPAPYCGQYSFCPINKYSGYAWAQGLCRRYI